MEKEVTQDLTGVEVDALEIHDEASAASSDAQEVDLDFEL